MDNSECNHIWEEIFDSAAYNDGFYVTTGYICKKCGAKKDIKNKNGANEIGLFEWLLMLPQMVVVLVLCGITMLIYLIIGAFKKVLNLSDTSN